ncbi:MAG: DUF4116 domain-containing protein [Parachlamydiaceae bacterium]|nr:DUF4116 domain-containing protein [Parachlamydiaceae bacterium]
MYIKGNGWSAEVNFINNTPNKLLVNQQYELSSIGLVSRFCKVFFFSLVSVMTLATWQKSLALVSHHWKEIKSKKAKCRAVIETHLFKNLHIATGKLEKIEDFANKLAQDKKIALRLITSDDHKKNSPKTLVIPSKSKKIEQVIVSANCVNKPKIGEFSTDIIRLINSFLRTEDRGPFLSTNKQMKGVIEQQTKLESFPCIHAIDRILNFLDAQSEGYKKLTELLKDRMITTPALDLEHRDVSIRNHLFDYMDLFQGNQRIQNDKESVIFLVKTNSDWLEYASDELKEDPDVVLAGIYNSPSAMKHAGPNIKNNREFILNACSKRGESCIRYTSNTLKHDRDLYVSLIALGRRYILCDAPDVIKNDRELILADVKIDHDEFLFVSIDLKEDKNFVLSAVKLNGMVLQYTPEFQNDFDIVLAAVKQNKRAILFASKIFQTYFYDCDAIKIEAVNLDSIKKPLGW